MNIQNLIEAEEQPINEYFKDTILIVDDDPAFRPLLAENLLAAQYDVLVAEDGIEAMRIFDRESIDLVITDINMAEIDGIELLGHIRGRKPNVEVILITGYESLETAKNALRLGAYDYIAKPFDMSRLLHSVKRALSELEVRREKETLLLSLIEREAEIEGKVKELQEESARLEMIEADLESSEERYRTLIEAVVKGERGIVVVQEDGSRKGIIKYANQRAVDLVGYSSEELIGKSLQAIIHPDSYDEVKKRYKRKLSGACLDSVYQCWGINKEGQKMPVEISSGITELEGKKILVCYVS